MFTIMVSDKLTNLFAETRLVGFAQVDAVEIVKAARRKTGAGEPPRYWIASIQRSRATIDEAASGLIRDKTPPCGDCRIGGIIKRAGRIVLEGDTWSGEDMFFARGMPGTIMASERFKRFCEVNDLANCSFVAAEDFSFDHHPHERSAISRRH